MSFPHIPPLRKMCSLARAIRAIRAIRGIARNNRTQEP
jgi:hypothetical protein